MKDVWDSLLKDESIPDKDEPSTVDGDYDHHPENEIIKTFYNNFDHLGHVS